MQPQLSPLVGDIPRSSFEFDFDFERRILAEAEKENQNWSKLGLENLPSKAPESTSSVVCFSSSCLKQFSVDHCGLWYWHFLYVHMINFAQVVSWCSCFGDIIMISYHFIIRTMSLHWISSRKKLSNINFWRGLCCKCRVQILLWKSTLPQDSMQKLFP